MTRHPQSHDLSVKDVVAENMCGPVDEAMWGAVAETVYRVVWGAVGEAAYRAVDRVVDRVVRWAVDDAVDVVRLDEVHRDSR